ncbi:hypothetical protein BDZ94DRAFT_805635 [Collybia nuda]|uniref:Uncharacterized protein n=1 Tax=Collybia nuda TaxID=64659 RepID=A0A9P6CI74_9AGAR|nr:hypothetical protein BDZ94DRAFT_805635 [Collybia nuda]
MIWRSSRTSWPRPTSLSSNSMPSRSPGWIGIFLWCDGCSKGDWDRTMMSYYRQWPHEEPVWFCLFDPHDDSGSTSSNSKPF